MVAILDRAGAGVAFTLFMLLGISALVLAMRWRRTPWLLALIAAPGAIAAFTGAAIWATEDLSLRFLLVLAPLVTVFLFRRRGERVVRIAGAAALSSVSVAAFFGVGALIAFLALYRG